MTSLPEAVPSPTDGRPRPIDSWYLAALSLLLAVVALALLARGYLLTGGITGTGSLAAPGDLVTEGAWPHPECSDSETLELGLGTTGFQSIEEAAAALGPRLWVADPSSLPPDVAFTQGAFQSRMLGQYRQTSWSLRYDGPAVGEKPPITLFVASFNAPRFQGPDGQVEQVSVQGRDALLFRPDPVEEQWGVVWKESCRWTYVVANLPPDRVPAVAEGIRPAA